MSSTKKTKIKSVARNDSDKFDLREKILAAARGMVLENGFAALSIRKLAEKIGYAPGTIYLYFQSRDEITREICVRGFVRLSAAIKAVSDISEPTERLYALLHAYTDFAVENPETYRLSFMEDPKFTEEMFRAAPLENEQGAGRQAFAEIVKVVCELKKDGKLADEADENLIAEMFWTGVHGVVSLKLIYPAFPTSDTTTLVDKMIQTLLNGCAVGCEMSK